MRPLVRARTITYLICMKKKLSYFVAKMSVFYGFNSFLWAVLALQ